MRRVQGGLIALLAVVMSGVELCAQPSGQESMCGPAGCAVDRVKQQVRDPATQPFPDIGMTVSLPKEYPRPPSAWQSKEKMYYEELLSKGRFDVLVVPFQVQLYALDRASRSLMTAELALALAAAQKSRVPDPYLVARALGDGYRRVDPTDVYRLAIKLFVRRIVWVYVGHDRKYEMRMTVQYQDRGADGEIGARTAFATRQFEKIGFSDEKPPIEVYQALLPEILKFVAPDLRDPTVPIMRASPGVVALPASVHAMTLESAEPGRDAHYLQLMAALTPYFSDRTRERFVEKSLLAVRRMRPESNDYRLLKARGLGQMGLRPAAIAVLGNPVTVEEKCLKSVLNGNLTEAERFSAQIKPGLNSLIAKLEINLMATAFGVRDQKESITETNALKLPGMAWPLFAMWSMTDLDPWSQRENIRLKDLLDRELPIPGFTAEGIVRGAVALGDVKKAQALADLSVLDHVRKVREAESAKWCCVALVPRPATLDYLDFVESLGEDNLMRRARFLTEVQVTPEAAIEFLSKIESAYRDHPNFVTARAEAELRLADRAEGASRDGLTKSAYVDAFNVWYWEQGQSHAAALALDIRMRLAGRFYDYGNPDNLYVGDFPSQPHYPTWDHSGALFENIQAALKNATYNFGPALQLANLFGESKQWDKVEELIASIDGRFLGHPLRSIILAKVKELKGDVEGAERYFRAGIKDRPNHWDTYLDLGKLLIEKGQFDEAAKLFNSYPGFKKGSGENPVSQANYLFDAGSLLYWTGNFSLASPLYRMAADLHTGAEAGLEGGNRIQLMNGDYAGAMAGSLLRAKRYNSRYAYRDYLGLLHSMDRSTEAWDAFNLLARQIDAPELWETALVGHQRAGATEVEIGAWAAQDWVRKAGKFGYAAMYLLRASVTDRMPSKDLSRLVAEVDRPVWKGLEGSVVRPALDNPMDQQLLGPKSGSESNVVIASPDALRGQRVKSDLVTFAEAYRAIRVGDFRAAHAEMLRASLLLDMTQPALSYLLPYYAYAAAKAGHLSMIVALLEGMPADRRRFDYYLARGVIAGLAGNTAEALRLFDAGLRRRPFTKDRPLFTEYQFAELCEWLYAETKDAKYRDKALGWAKKAQVFAPWFGWAYAIEAKYSRNAGERRRAIALAYYLDRNSERLATLPKGDVEAARKAFGQRNPFVKQVAPPKEKSA